MGHIIALLLAALFCSSSFAQAPATGKKAAAPPQTTCDAEKEKAWAEGWGQGWDGGLHVGWSTGLAAFSTTVPVAGKQMKIELVLEDIEGSDSYRLAAAEVVRTHFSDWFVVVPDSPLTLYVGGTEAIGTQTMGLDVRVQVVVKHRVAADGEVRGLWGTLVLARQGGVLAGYNVERRTQTVREWAYKVVSEFLKKWQESPELPKDEPLISRPK